MAATRRQIIFAKEVVVNIKFICVALLVAVMNLCFQYIMNKPDYYSLKEVSSQGKVFSELRGYLAKNPPTIIGYVEGRAAYRPYTVPDKLIPLDFKQTNMMPELYFYNSRHSKFFDEGIYGETMEETEEETNVDVRTIFYLTPAYGSKTFSDYDYRFADEMNHRAKTSFEKYITETTILLFIISSVLMIVVRYLYKVCRWFYLTSKLEV